jgi:hypothetical protein
MIRRLHRRALLLTGVGVLCAGVRGAPAGAQMPPIIIPVPPPIIIIDTAPQPSLEIAADEVDETFTGQVTGNADVDLDVDSYHEEGEATAR